MPKHCDWCKILILDRWWMIWILGFRDKVGSIGNRPSTGGNYRNNWADLKLSNDLDILNYIFFNKIEKCMKIQLSRFELFNNDRMIQICSTISTIHIIIVGDPGSRLIMMRNGHGRNVNFKKLYIIYHFLNKSVLLNLMI